MLLEHIGELDAAFGEERRFESGNAAQTPPGIGDGLNQLALAQANGRELLFERRQMALVFGGVIARKQNGTAREGGFDGVEARLGFAFLGAGAGGELGVGAIGLQPDRLSGHAGS